MRIDRITLIAALNELRDVFEEGDGDIFRFNILSKYFTLPKIIVDDRKFSSYEDIVRRLCFCADYHVENFSHIVLEKYAILSFVLKDDFSEDRIIELNWINNGGL